MPNYQSGGAFLPEGDVNFKGTVNFSGTTNFETTPTFGPSGATALVTTTGTQTLTNKTLTAPTISAPAISGAATIATGATITQASIVAPAITGGATVASGATITTPQLSITPALVTATGSTGGNGAVIPTVFPAAIIVTGATGSGVDLLTGPVGALLYIQNMAAASMRFYSVGGFINGTTGTTAYVITNTGNKAAWAVCTTATGAWFIGGNT